MKSERKNCKLYLKTQANPGNPATSDVKKHKMTARHRPVVGYKKVGLVLRRDGRKIQMFQLMFSVFGPIAKDPPMTSRNARSNLLHARPGQKGKVLFHALCRKKDRPLTGIILSSCPGTDSSTAGVPPRRPSRRRRCDDPRSSPPFRRWTSPFQYHPVQESPSTTGFTRSGDLFTSSSGVMPGFSRISRRIVQALPSRR